MSRKINDGLTANQRYYRKNRERNNERVKEWYAANPDKQREKNRRYYWANVERLREMCNENGRRHRSEQHGTPKQRLKEVQAKARRRARLAEVEVALTNSEWLEIVEFHGGKCVYCGCVPETLEMDHVVPISKGGGHTKENVVPACKPCNSSKGNRPERPPRCG